MIESGELVIPISQLFFDDAGPHVARTTTSPELFGGTTLASLAETNAARQRTPDSAPLYTPARGRELHALLDASIARLGAISGVIRKAPALPPPVPIESLLYRGRGALDRALQIRTATRKFGRAPTAEMVDELLDLIALAAAE
jgi:hypothetical protein